MQLKLRFTAGLPTRIKLNLSTAQKLTTDSPFSLLIVFFFRPLVNLPVVDLRAKLSRISKNSLEITIGTSNERAQLLESRPSHWVKMSGDLINY